MHSIDAKRTRQLLWFIFIKMDLNFDLKLDFNEIIIRKFETF